MPRRGDHGAATLRETAAELGCSTETVRRVSAPALAKLEPLITAIVSDVLADDVLRRYVRLLAWRSYLERLAACKFGECPDDDPPAEM